MKTNYPKSSKDRKIESVTTEPTRFDPFYDLICWTKEEFEKENVENSKEDVATGKSEYCIIEIKSWLDMDFPHKTIGLFKNPVDEKIDFGPRQLTDSELLAFRVDSSTHKTVEKILKKPLFSTFTVPLINIGEELLFTAESDKEAVKSFLTNSVEKKNVISKGCGSRVTLI